MIPASARVEPLPGRLAAAEELPGQPTGRGKVGPSRPLGRLGSGAVAAVAEGATWRR